MGDPVSLGLMAVSAGMSAASTMSSAGAASGRGRATRDAMFSQGNSLRFQAGQLRDQANEVDTQVAIEENQKMTAYMSMMAANRVDIPTRGVGDSASTDAIMRHNQESTGQDLLAVKYMGSSKASRLRANAQQSDDAADVFYKGGTAAMQQGEAESTGRLISGGFSLLSSMPNMVTGFKMMGNMFGGGGSVAQPIPQGTGGIWGSGGIY
jgi:hypothetical protein